MRSYVFWQKVVDTLTAAPLRTTVGKRYLNPTLSQASTSASVITFCAGSH